MSADGEDRRVRVTVMWQPRVIVTGAGMMYELPGGVLNDLYGGISLDPDLLANAVDRLPSIVAHETVGMLDDLVAFVAPADALTREDSYVQQVAGAVLRALVMFHESAGRAS